MPTIYCYLRVTERRNGSLGLRDDDDDADYDEGCIVSKMKGKTIFQAIYTLRAVRNRDC